jgi:multidrug efflux pump subunit AcrA (membrane-fusion protein)
MLPRLINTDSQSISITVKTRTYLSLAFAATLALASCGGKKTEEFSPKISDITETVFASGVLDADDKYSLTAQSEGYLSEVLVSEGDSVQAGALVAVIDNLQNDANARAAADQLAIARLNTSDKAPAVRDLEASLDYAKKKLAQDELQYKRYQTLYASKSVSSLDLENTRLAYEASLSNVNSVSQKLELTRQQAKQAEITQQAQQSVTGVAQNYNRVLALSKGKVVKRFKQRGDYVRKGDVIATIANDNTLLAKLNVDENSIARVQLGMPVQIRLNVRKDTVMQGVVSEILPQFDDATQSFICKVRFTSAPAFSIIGTQLEANILVGEKKGVMLIPRSYLNFSNQVQLKDVDSLRTIQVGIKSTEWVEVVGGLNESDVLVPLKK